MYALEGLFYLSVCVCVCVSVTTNSAACPICVGNKVLIIGFFVVISSVSFSENALFKNCGVNCWLPPNDPSMDRRQCLFRT